MSIIKVSRRNASVWYFLLFIGVSLFILLWMRSNSSTPENFRLTWADENEIMIAVPLSLVMAGKPLVLPQNDQIIMDFIWANGHIEPPSDNPYELEDPHNDPSRGQGQYIRRILNNLTGGFFVECGALDGETRSNTLFMEMHMEWKGLLIEGDPSNYELLKKKNRKAWTSNTCLSVKPHPHTTNFLQKFNQGKVLDSDENTLSTKNKKLVKVVQCMPLFSLLAAINVSTIDYFSLDVEGNELQVLKTIPFDKIYIRTLSVEYIHTSEGKDATLEFMTSNGYRLVGEVHFPNNLANDLIFVHQDVNIETE